MSNNLQIGWRDFMSFISPAGQNQMLEFVRKAKEERGKQWLPHIKKEFPLASWIIDLAVNKTADETMIELKNTFPHYPIFLAENQIKSLHARIKFEIEKER